MFKLGSSYRRDAALAIVFNDLRSCSIAPNQRSHSKLAISRTLSDRVDAAE